jgi:hypothetical protein
MALRADNPTVGTSTRYFRRADHFLHAVTQIGSYCNVAGMGRDTAGMGRDGAGVVPGCWVFRRDGAGVVPG